MSRAVNYHGGRLSIEGLQRMQKSLDRRVADRDAENIRQVGFAPYRADLYGGELLEPASDSLWPLTAQFDVKRKLPAVSVERRVAAVESVRLLDRNTRRFQKFEFRTDVCPTGDIEPTGVQIAYGAANATTSVVVRWTRQNVEPSAASAQTSDDLELYEDPRWRWGVLSVSHLFAADSKETLIRARVERAQTCGVGPGSVVGQVVARGRVPSGPDICLIETGLDRLWLSGLLPRPSSSPIVPAGEEQLLHWISTGTKGTFVGDGVSHDWSWQTFYPELQIEGLGRLRNMVRYQSLIEGGRPFGPGSSGGILVAGGIPIGLQVAAIGPAFEVGFAQCFNVSLQWLRQKLRATALHIVHLLIESK